MPSEIVSSWDGPGSSRTKVNYFSVGLAAILQLEQSGCALMVACADTKARFHLFNNHNQCVLVRAA